MFNKIFIIEDTYSDAEDLIESLSIFINKNNIIVIENIEDVLSTISDFIRPNSKIAIFIDIWWHSEKRGIKLAQSIRKKYSDVKLIAFTTSREGEIIKELYGNFDAFVDKNSGNPHPSSIKIWDIDDTFLEELASGKQFLENQKTNFQALNNVNGYNDSYFFTVSSQKKESSQFLFVDFSEYSQKDEDLQLERFLMLRKALFEIYKTSEFIGAKYIFLPTGDGVAIGIVTNEVSALALKMAISLLQSLQKSGLSKEIRIGVHFGPVYILIGSLGEKQIIGPGINKAARIEAASKAGKILVSEEYYSLFVYQSEDIFCKELDIQDEPQEFTVKKDQFRARFISKGQFGR